MVAGSIGRRWWAIAALVAVAALSACSSPVPPTPPPSGVVRIATDATFPALSDDGRYVAYIRSIPNPFISPSYLFRFDRATGTEELVSKRPDGSPEIVPGSEPTVFEETPPAISGDGRYVAVRSMGRHSTLDTNFGYDIYRFDTQTGAIDLVSVKPDGGLGAGDRCSAGGPCGTGSVGISDDGRFVVFPWGPDDLVTGDGNGSADVLRRDMVTGTTQLVSVTAGGVQGGAASGAASVSDDGRQVAFSTSATNLVPGSNAATVLVKDTLTGTLTRLSDPSSSRPYALWPAISGNGMFVAMVESETLDLNGPGSKQVTRRRVVDGAMELASRSPAGDPVDGLNFFPSISDDGQRISFASSAVNLVPGSLSLDVYLTNLTSGQVARVSR
ncbi:MAG TPA: hypothetical protein VJM33_10820, partial [Microthrixaceae bacterium]|nr:hypothetical protein [Microthrixaceae bacterium]